MSRSSRRSAGFTLVELLVVIGIIALLISMLLPALNRARQQANMVDCQARMRQMGQAILLYSVNNKNYLPASNFTHPGPVPGGWHYPEVNGWGEFHMPATLSRVLGHPNPSLYDLNPIFEDKDIADMKGQVSWMVGQKYLNTYNFNSRVFSDLAVNDPRGTKPFPLTPITKVANSSELVAAYDGVQFPGYAYNAFKNSTELQDKNGGWSWWGAAGLTTRTTSYYPLELAVGVNKQRAGNVDFRHNKETTANVLFLDGHVESRKVGELKVKEFLLPL